MKKRKLSMKVLLVVAAGLLIPLWSVAAGAVEGKSAPSPSLSGQSGDEASATAESGERGVWNGCLMGQASSPLKTDFVKGVEPSAGAGAREVWNGCIIGQASSPLKTDFAVLPAAKSGEREVRKGYLTGSFCPWQQKL
jgi:hypothetical protein